MLAPLLVVEVLLAPGVIDAGCLDVAARVGADPDLGPGRRDRELGGSFDDLWILDPRPVLFLIAEATPAADPVDPGTGAVGFSKAGHGRSERARGALPGSAACETTEACTMIRPPRRRKARLKRLPAGIGGPIQDKEER
jgi:hypothetical protein